MFRFLLKRLSNQKGAIENILIVLIMVIIGVGAVISFSSWMNGETEDLKTKTSTKIETTIEDAKGN